MNFWLLSAQEVINFHVNVLNPEVLQGKLDETELAEWLRAQRKG